MSTATIYATGIHKPKESKANYSYGILKGRAKKPKKIIGQIESTSRIESQLNILLFGIQLVLEDSAVEEVKVISDFALIEKITDGTIEQWAIDNWEKPNGKPIPQAELWQEIFTALQKFEITFSTATDNDGNMAEIIKSAKDSGKKKLPPAEKVEVTPEAESEVEPIIAEQKEEEEVAAATSQESSKTATKENVKSATVSENKIQPEAVLSTKNSITLDGELLREAELLFGKLGLTTEQAVTVYLKHSIRNQGISLDLRL